MSILQRPVGAICQIPGCNADLSGLKMYYQRCKICEAHHRASIILVEDQPMRFCQQCAALQPLSDFSKDRRSCIAALARHNTRRKQSPKLKVAETSTETNPDDDATADADEEYQPPTRTSAACGRAAGGAAGKRPRSAQSGRSSRAASPSTDDELPPAKAAARHQRSAPTYLLDDDQQDWLNTASRLPPIVDFPFAAAAARPADFDADDNTILDLLPHRQPQPHQSLTPHQQLALLLLEQDPQLSSSSTTTTNTSRLHLLNPTARATQPTIPKPQTTHLAAAAADPLFDHQLQHLPPLTMPAPPAAAFAAAAPSPSSDDDTIERLALELFGTSAAAGRFDPLPHVLPPAAADELPAAFRLAVKAAVEAAVRQQLGCIEVVVQQAVAAALSSVLPASGGGGGD